MSLQNVIIDGNNYVNIALHRAKSLILRDAPDKMDEYYEGLFRKLLLTMLKGLIRIFGDFSTYYIVWDSKGGGAWRKELVPTYKNSRKSEANLPKSVEIGKQVSAELNISSIELPEVEADDIIYTLCTLLAHDENVIVSRDNDFIQIVQKGYATKVFDPVKKQALPIPEYDIVLFKALSGDSSDNIPGLPGVGPKTALKMMKGSLDTSLLSESARFIVEAHKTVIDLSLNPSYEDNKKALIALLQRPSENKDNN